MTTDVASADLLPVLDQDLFASLGELGTMLLQAGQHGLIAIIEDRPAKSRGITRAGIVSDLLGGGAGCDEKDGNDEEKSGHPLLRPQTTPPPVHFLGLADCGRNAFCASKKGNEATRHPSLLAGGLTHRQAEIGWHFPSSWQGAVVKGAR